MKSQWIEQATKIGQLLKAKNWKIAVAESCTAGGLGYALTSVSGSSTWVENGFIVYSNHAKMHLLHVQPQTLEQYGAVSEETAIELALNCLNWSEVDLAISITGIAGPLGGSEQKPIGTVWIGLADKSKVFANHYLFKGDRASIREKAIEAALELLLLSIS